MRISDWSSDVCSSDLGALAAALGAEKVIYLTDVAGLLADVSDPASVISRIGSAALQTMVDDGTLTGGMIPKIEACLAAVRNGVSSAHLLDGRQPHVRSDEHTSELQSLMRTSYAVLC